MKQNENLLFETSDHEITNPVHIEQETVWLNRNQIAELFGSAIRVSICYTE